MRNTYTVQIGSEMSPNFSEIECSSRREAMEIARAEASKTTQHIFVSFYRHSDSQTVFINPDGSHAITGQAWN